MMLASWLKQVLHSKVSFPQGIGGQCVDLCNDYITTMWGADPLRLNAEDWPRATIAHALWVRNEPANYPLMGDVVCWRGPLATIGLTAYGHCAVAITADPHYLLSCDQNWSGVQRAELIMHDYTGVAGWWTVVPARPSVMSSPLPNVQNQKPR